MALPITVAAGPVAAGSATKISLSQKAAGAQKIVLNGAAGSFTANNICLSQTPGGAGALTLNGSTVVSSVAYLPNLPTPQYIYITCAGNESGRSFVVVGTIFTPNGPLAVTETITGANASVVSSAKQYNTIVSITVDAGTAGALTVGSYSFATLDVARRVLFTSGGNDSGITFTLTGTDWAGSPIGETVTGANAGTAVSVLDYLTITSITTSGAVATTLTVGTNGVAGSPWVRFDDFAAAAQVAIQATVSGTANYSIQTTLEDPNRVTNQLPTATYQWSRAAVTWIDSTDSAVVSATASKSSTFTVAPIFARVLLNSSTGTGSVTATFRQAYLGS